MRNYHFTWIKLINDISIRYGSKSFNVPEGRCLVEVYLSVRTCSSFKQEGFTSISCFHFHIT